MSNSNTTIQTEYALDQEHIYEKYEKVFDGKKDLSIFFDDYEKSIPIKKKLIYENIKCYSNKKIYNFELCSILRYNNRRNCRKK